MGGWRPSRNGPVAEPGWRWSGGLAAGSSLSDTHEGRRRGHLRETVVQRAIAVDVREAGLMKGAT
jgi:hypothetical protein